MIDLRITDINQIIAFWLIFTRWLVVVIQLPIFENLNVASSVKVLFTIVITFAFFPDLKGVMIKDIMAQGENAFWSLTLFNVFVGLSIGYVVRAILGIYTTAGSLITQQIGFSAVRYFDPFASQSMGPFEKFIQITVLVMIISSGALIPMFKGTFISFETITIFKLSTISALPQFFFEYFKSIFISGLLLASPLIFTNLLIMVILGIISRTVPQMNVLMVSFVVNIGVGLLIFLGTSYEFFHVGYNMYVNKLGEWFKLINI